MFLVFFQMSKISTVAKVPLHFSLSVTPSWPRFLRTARHLVSSYVSRASRWHSERIGWTCLCTGLLKTGQLKKTENSAEYLLSSHLYLNLSQMFWLRWMKMVYFRINTITTGEIHFLNFYILSIKLITSSRVVAHWDDLRLSTMHGVIELLQIA